MGHNIKEAPEN